MKFLISHNKKKIISTLPVKHFSYIAHVHVNVKKISKTFTSQVSDILDQLMQMIIMYTSMTLTTPRQQIHTRFFQTMYMFESIH